MIVWQCLKGFRNHVFRCSHLPVRVCTFHLDQQSCRAGYQFACLVQRRDCTVVVLVFDKRPSQIAGRRVETEGLLLGIRCLCELL